MDKTIKLLVIKAEDNKRLDLYLQNKLKKYSRSLLKKIIETKGVKINGIINFSPSTKVKFKDKVTQNLNFDKVNNDIFPLIKLKNKILEFPSSPIIVNAANEILVDHFLNKKLQFLRINKIIMSVLNDRNYKKYAIRKPKNINHIIEIDKWARETAKKYVS